MRCRRERRLEVALHLRQVETVLWALRPGHRRHHACQIQLDRVREFRVGRLIGAEQPLLFRIGFDQSHQIRRPVGEAQIPQGFAVDRKETHGGAVLGRHVGHRSAVRQAQRAQPAAIKFDELADYPFLPQHLGNREHQIGRGTALAQFAV